MKAEQKSLTARLEIIDSLIQQNQIKSASKELKKIEKKLIDSWSYIGVYRRYMQIADEKSAESILKKGLEKNKENLELKAVYSEFLLKKDRMDEAEKTAAALQNTKYGSIYSEIILKAALKDASTENKLDYFLQEKFYPIYFDAYQGSKSPVWIKNCAVYDLYNGYLQEAAKLNPEAYADADDAYFWATVLYDAGKYYDSIAAVEESKKYLNDYGNNSPFRVTKIAQTALEADSYLSVSDFDGSEKIRQELLNVLSEQVVSKNDNELLPVVLLNSAIWAKSQNNDDRCADLLFDLVNRYPEYVAGLILYADFAWSSNQEREEDDEVKALRRAGLKSLGMEKYDNRRRIPLSDALYRIDECLKNNLDPYLQIEKLDLEYKSNKNLSEAEETRDLWQLLEKNYIEGEKYKELLVQYAVNYLLRTKQTDAAWELFSKYISGKYEFSDKEDFFVQAAEKIKDINLPLAEFCGYFAAWKEKLPEAIRIYEFCVFESAGTRNENEISTRVSTAVCMNLCDIYFANGEIQKALELYGKAGGREAEVRLRSEIYYRIALIYYSTGDAKNALRSADYAVSIFPENEMAVLLRNKLRIE